MIKEDDDNWDGNDGDDELKDWGDDELLESGSSGFSRSYPDINNNIDADEIEIENEASQVSSTRAKNFIVIGILCIASVVFLYNVVFKDDEVEKEKKELARIIKEQPIEQAVKVEKPDEKSIVDAGVVETPDAPDIEGLQELAPPPPLEEVDVTFPDDSFDDFEPAPPPEPIPAEAFTPPPAPVIEKVAAPVLQPVAPASVPIPVPVVIQGPSPEELAARERARRKSGMMVLNGGGSPSSAPQSGIGGARDPLADYELSGTAATQVTATQIGNLEYMIAQGKMIDAVLETAINTDLEGSLRAVISRDVYAEAGRNILIPRGSRLIGTYSSSIAKGQQRVVVAWSRVIRPDGIDIAIDSPGTDQLGRAGMSGIVDNKYFEIFSQSILLSAITIGGTMLIDSLKKSQGTSSSTTTSAVGNSTTSQSGTPTDFAVLESVGSFGDVAQSITSGLLSDQPTIVVSQGSRIKVFVNRDLIFPKSTVGNIRIVN